MEGPTPTIPSFDVAHELTMDVDVDVVIEARNCDIQPVGLVLARVAGHAVLGNPKWRDDGTEPVVTQQRP